MVKPTYEELTALLQRSHQALENITDLYGCMFPVAVTLVDCENALKAIKEAELKAAEISKRADQYRSSGKKGLRVVH